MDMFWICSRQLWDSWRICSECVLYMCWVFVDTALVISDIWWILSGCVFGTCWICNGYVLDMLMAIVA